MCSIVTRYDKTSHSFNVRLLFAISVLQNGSHLWQLALQKRKEGRCPLEPGEVAVILRAMGYPKETQIYVASGQVYGGQNRMAPLRNMFPNLVNYLRPLWNFQNYFMILHFKIFNVSRWLAGVSSTKNMMNDIKIVNLNRSNGEKPSYILVSS